MSAPLRFPPAPPPPRAAFSLVEVTIAMALIVFSLVVLLALIPVGMGTLSDTRQEAEAANAMEQIVTEIRLAAESPANSGKYGATNYPTVRWALGQGPVSVLLPGLSETGHPTSEPAQRRLAAHVQLEAPASHWSPGRARISVAWPANAAVWSDADAAWKNARGSVTSWITIPPR